MRSLILKRISAGLAAAMLMFTNVILPVQPAFATATGGGAGQVTALNGTDQPVWCQLTGQGWKSLLGDESSGNSSQRYELNELPDGHSEEVYIGTDGQVYAPNRSDRALKQELANYCAEQYTSVPLPPMPQVICANGQVSWAVPEDTDLFKWTLTDSKHLTVEIIPDGIVFEGTNINFHNYVLGSYDGITCTVHIPSELATSDPCNVAKGENNSYYTDESVNALRALSNNITVTVNSDRTVNVTADEGYRVVVDGSQTDYQQYTYPAPTDKGSVCATPENPTWNNPCGRVNDTYTIPETEGVNYYINGELIEAGTYSAKAKNVTFTAMAQDSYELTSALEVSYKFTNERCEPQVILETKAWCDVLDTKIKAVLTNTTNSTQRYEVVIKNSESDELYTEVVHLKKGQSTKVYAPVSGDGEFTVNVYAMKGKKRGMLLESKTVPTECVDDFTPQIFKKNQNGQILSTGKFDVEVCQPYADYSLALVVDTEQQNCETYNDVTFDTDGSWYATNVDFEGYELNKPTMVTITETEAPAGCTAALTPWVFNWNYTVTDVYSLNNNHMMDGSWNTANGSNVFNLTNQCDEGGKGGSGGETPTPTPKPTHKPKVTKTVNPSETLANTGTSTNGILAIAVAMLLASIGFAVSPRFGRTDA